jgi:hypothetical protein
MRWLKGTGWIALCWILLSSPAWARPKTDTIWTDSGDRVVCEILELTRGKIQVKTHDMGTIDIEWEHVAALHSSYYYRVEIRGGSRFFGSLNLDQSSPYFQIQRRMDTVTVRLLDIVEITAIEKNFWSRMDGSLALGFSYTQASRVAQLTWSWNNRYRTERDLVDLKSSIIITARKAEDSTARNEDISLTYYRLMKSRLNGSVTSTYQRNDEIGLRARLSFGLTGGVSPLKSNLHTLLLSLGAATNSEIGTSDTSVVTTSVEGVVRVNYALFQYSSPKTDINTTLTFFPSLTEKGRYRLDYDLKLRRELIKDFFFDITFYSRYDSDPATENAAKLDYGIVTSVSFSY